MLRGLQTHFNERVPMDVLELIATRVAVGRIDAQRAAADVANEMIADVRAVRMVPHPIVRTLEQLESLPDGIDVDWFNEAVIGKDLPAPIPALEYRASLEAAYPIAQRKRIRLWGGVTANLQQRDLDWLNAMNFKTLPADIACAVHHYTPGRNFEQSHRGFSSRESEVKWLKAAIGPRVWGVTEFGYPSGPGQMPEADAAREIAQEWAFWESQGAERAILYQINDSPIDEHDYGLRRADGAIKPAIFETFPIIVRPEPQPEPEPSPEPVPAPLPELPADQYGRWIALAGIIGAALQRDRGGFSPADIAHFLHNVEVEGRPLNWVLWDIGGRKGDEPQPPAPPPPPTRPLPTFPIPDSNRDLSTWGRRKGATWASSLLARPVDYRAWAKLLGRVFNGRFHTQVNVTSARWPSLDPVAIWPFVKIEHGSDAGKFDLYAKNHEFWNDRLPYYVEAMNLEGGIVQLCLMDLYQFSNRKATTMDKNLSPVRHNVNGIYWPGDDTFLAQQLPDAWWLWFAQELATALRGAAVAYVPFNEGPEKDIHIAIADALMRGDPNATVIVNRNEDTPGQYWNMKVGRSAIDMIAYHGWKSTSDFTETYDEVDELPNTFNMMLARMNQRGETVSVDWKRIIASSDGARRHSSQGGNDLIDPNKSWREWRVYDWDALLQVWKKVIDAGGNIEHQSVLKMDRTDDVKFDLSIAEVGFMEEMARL